MIDPFQADWLEQLAKWLAAMPKESNMFLLVDGAFMPGLFRSRELDTVGAGPVALLFEALPGCSEATRDVSPFLVPLERVSRSLVLRLEQCSGWPMVSAIETTESLPELYARLAAWCIVEADDHRFNFRFPDTRRLSRIFDALTPQQRAQFTGPAIRWSYIGRAGGWEHLQVDGKDSDVVSEPQLDNAQFRALVEDSEPDEVLVQLAYRGFEPVGMPSIYHAQTCMALRIADAAKLDQPLRVDWCEFVLKHETALSESDAKLCLPRWRAGQV